MPWVRVFSVITLDSSLQVLIVSHVKRSLCARLRHLTYSTWSKKKTSYLSHCMNCKDSSGPLWIIYHLILETQKNKPEFLFLFQEKVCFKLLSTVSWFETKKNLFSFVLKTSFGVASHREEMRCSLDLLCHFMAIFCLYKIVPCRTIALLLLMYVVMFPRLTLKS